jgi:hypothetical protein
VSYVTVQSPTSPMIVTSPPSPILTYALLPNQGILGQYLYAYCVTSVINGVEGAPVNWVFPQIVNNGIAYGIQLTWDAMQGVSMYKVYGRKAGQVGLLESVVPTVGALTYTYLDDGSTTPTGLPPNEIAQVPIQYNSLGTLVVNVAFSERQSRISY